MAVHEPDEELDIDDDVLPLVRGGQGRSAGDVILAAACSTPGLVIALCLATWGLLWVAIHVAAEAGW